MNIGSSDIHHLGYAGIKESIRFVVGHSIVGRSRKESQYLVGFGHGLCPHGVHDEGTGNNLYPFIKYQFLGNGLAQKNIAFSIPDNGIQRIFLPADSNPALCVLIVYRHQCTILEGHTSVCLRPSKRSLNTDIQCFGRRWSRCWCGRWAGSRRTSIAHYHQSCQGHDRNSHNYCLFHIYLLNFMNSVSANFYSRMAASPSAAALLLQVIFDTSCALAYKLLLS